MVEERPQHAERAEHFNSWMVSMGGKNEKEVCQKVFIKKCNYNDNIIIRTIMCSLPGLNHGNHRHI